MKGNDNTIDQSMNSDDPNPNKLDSNAMLINLLNIPKVEMKLFNGDPLDYPSFMAILMKLLPRKLVIIKLNCQGCCNIRQARHTVLLKTAL